MCRRHVLLILCVCKHRDILLMKTWMFLGFIQAGALRVATGFKYLKWQLDIYLGFFYNYLPFFFLSLSINLNFPSYWKMCMLQISIYLTAECMLKNTHPAVFKVLIKTVTQERKTKL